MRSKTSSSRTATRVHETYGYYAHGVGPETITAPAGWEQRLQKLEFPPIRRQSGEAVGWCLSLPDLLLAKLAAARPHDLTFVEAALAARLVEPHELETGIPLLPETVRDGVEERLGGIRTVRPSEAARALGVSAVGRDANACSAACCGAVANVRPHWTSTRSSLLDALELIVNRNFRALRTTVSLRVA